MIFKTLLFNVHLSDFIIITYSLKNKKSYRVIRDKKIQSSVYSLAERTGFEPAVELPLHTLSKRAP